METNILWQWCPDAVVTFIVLLKLEFNYFKKILKDSPHMRRYVSRLAFEISKKVSRFWSGIADLACMISIHFIRNSSSYQGYASLNSDLVSDHTQAVKCVRRITLLVASSDRLAVDKFYHGNNGPFRIYLPLILVGSVLWTFLDTRKAPNS